MDPQWLPNLNQATVERVRVCRCRPRKGLQEAHSIRDIQGFLMVTLPLSRPAPVRLIVVGKKRLPEKGERAWATVVAVASTVSVQDCSHCCIAKCPAWIPDVVLEDTNSNRRKAHASVQEGSIDL